MPIRPQIVGSLTSGVDAGFPYGRGSSRGVLSAGGMDVIYEVSLGALVLQIRRDLLPSGEAEQRARATDSSDG